MKFTYQEFFTAHNEWNLCLDQTVDSETLKIKLFFTELFLFHFICHFLNYMFKGKDKLDEKNQFDLALEISVLFCF